VRDVNIVRSIKLFAKSILLVFLSIGLVPALATETTTYEYDALGRLVKSTKAGGPSSGTEKATAYDPAGNRTNQTVTGAPDNVGGGNSNVIVLPIGDSGG